MSKERTELNRVADARLAELILYIATLSEGDPRFGAVKLNKLLFFADFQAYLRFGKAITGQEYQKLEYGPAPRRLPQVLDELKRRGDVAVREHDYYGHNQQRAFALREADLSLFTAAEIDLVCRIVHEYCGKNASEISADSHEFIGWQIVELGETIPYNLALIGRRPLTERERQWGIELESRAEEFLAANGR